ncbi:hypothetical protein [Lacticaseibacillus brantae]|nr:hypothetical protein [Lacticaseibacillus brantae]
MSTAQRVSSYAIFSVLFLMSVSSLLTLPVGGKFWMALFGAVDFGVLLVITAVRDVQSKGGHLQ